jgi:hypothetical protein
VTCKIQSEDEENASTTHGKDLKQDTKWFNFHIDTIGRHEFFADLESEYTFRIKENLASK